MTSKHILNACMVAFITAATLFVWSERSSNDEQIPAAAPEETAPITTEQALSYIEQGEAILSMATDAFVDNPDRAMGSVLLQITDEFNALLGGLCQVPGTQEACTNATATIVNSYTVLYEYAKKLEGE